MRFVLYIFVFHLIWWFILQNILLYCTERLHFYWMNPLLAWNDINIIIYSQISTYILNASQYCCILLVLPSNWMCLDIIVCAQTICGDAEALHLDIIVYHWSTKCQSCGSNEALHSYWMYLDAIAYHSSTNFDRFSFTNTYDIILNLGFIFFYLDL